MRVVIVGAGQVGTTIAEDLSVDNDVIVIDTDPDRIEELKYSLDVMTITGDGSSLAVLEEVDIEEADMFIASTDDDRVNLLACEIVKTVADPFTVARTKQAKYLETWERDEGTFGVDLMIGSDLMAAENIVRVVGVPSAIDVDPFAGGQVQMAEFEIGPDSPITGQTVAQADRFEQLTFTGLFRDGDVILPQGDTLIKADDRAVVIGGPRSVQAFADDITPEATPNEADEIVIIGGSQIGYHTARLLEQRGISPRVVEQDPDRARELAEELPDTLVLENDVTDKEFLSRAYVDEADVVIAALPSDERNLLVSMLARQLGTDRIVAVVDNHEYVALFEEIGIDAAVNPRDVTAEEIIRFTHRTVAENLAVLENDQAKVLELELTEASELLERSIEDIITDLNGRAVFGAIIRDSKLITPRGETTLQPGDNIVVFVESGLEEAFTAMA